MADVVFYGASDDLIEVEGDCPGCDEYPADAATFVCVGGEAQTRIRVWYASVGVWGVAILPVDEDVPMLPVAVTAAERGYSVRAVVTGVGIVIRQHDDA